MRRGLLRWTVAFSVGRERRENRICDLTKSGTGQRLLEGSNVSTTTEPGTSYRTLTSGHTDEFKVQSEGWSVSPTKRVTILCSYTMVVFENLSGLLYVRSSMFLPRRRVVVSKLERWPFFLWEVSLTFFWKKKKKKRSVLSTHGYR